MRKQNLTHGGANSLYYKKYMSYRFDPDKSAELGCNNGKNSPCSDNDTIMVLNGWILKHPKSLSLAITVYYFLSFDIILFRLLVKCFK